MNSVLKGEEGHIARYCPEHYDVNYSDAEASHPLGAKFANAFGERFGERLVS